MEAQYIDYADTRCFSSALIRYIQLDESLKTFYSFPPTPEGFHNLLENKKVLANRAVLAKVLHHQYLSIDNQSALLKSNLSQLEQPNTFTITTGHQLNIFTGPLYFIFKIVTAINLAKDLQKQFPQHNFVPVYWMATEDHDFDEINHTYVGGKKISWNKQAAGATGREATKTIVDALNEYKGVLGISENALQLSKIIEDAYTKFETLADATRYLVNELFGKHGLVILDADHPELKKLFSSYITQDIIQKNSYQYITESNQSLSNIGIDAQVNPREINFFFLLDKLRERIVFENDRYLVMNAKISFSEEELKQEINLHPERFSPNVVMRPLYQEVILPNIAYVGGGAEVIYWLQLKANFEFYKVDFPILILRNSALFTNDKIALKLKRLNLDFTSIFEDSATLKSNWVKQHTQHQLHLKDEWQQLEAIFIKLKARVHQIDPTLFASTEAVSVRLKRAMDSLEKKLLRAEKRNFALALSDIDHIRNILFPGGGLQERKENFGLLYVKYGDEFIESLIHCFKPLDFKFTILH